MIQAPATPSAVAKELDKRGWNANGDFWTAPTAPDEMPSASITFEPDDSGVYAIINYRLTGGDVGMHETEGPVEHVISWLTLSHGGNEPILPVTMSAAYVRGYADGLRAATAPGGATAQLDGAS